MKRQIKASIRWGVICGALLMAGCSVKPLPPWTPPAPVSPLATQRVGAQTTEARARKPVARPKVMPGIVAPYSLERVIGTFGDCRPGGRQHRGLDLAGVGPNKGLGTPIWSMTRARVVRMAWPGDEDPVRYSRFDRREGQAKRGGQWLPRWTDAPGYGRVHFFTRGHGTSHTGVMLVVRVEGGPLDGHTLRYMHMASIHPALREGDLIEAGQEIGLMGGTAVQSSSPHVHIDLETPQGVRVDVAPLLGLEADKKRCRAPKRKRRKRRRKRKRR